MIKAKLVDSFPPISITESDYDHRQAFPYQLHICEKHWCFEKCDGTWNNKRLEEMLANEVGTTSDRIHGAMVQICGVDFRIERRRCQRHCDRAPIVTIIAEGNYPVPAKVTSLASLGEQVQQVIDGTWDYPDEPNESDV